MILDTTDLTDYRIIGGIRGLDLDAVNGAGLLKEITTGVIRDFAGIDSFAVVSVEASVAKEAWGYAYAVEREETRALWRRVTHFRKHVIMAFSGLHQKGVEGADDYLHWVLGELDA